MGQRGYTDEQLRKIFGLRDFGSTYADIAAWFHDEYGRRISTEAVRHLVRAWKDVDLDQLPQPRAPAPAPRVKTPKILPPRPEDNTRILVISDMHVPYQHPDTVPFLQAVKEKYKPTRVVCVGDEVDHHAMSFHDSDPDLLSAGDELLKSIEMLQPLYEMFPDVDLIDSNHGSMSYRKGKANNVPRKYLRDYNEVLDAPTGWRWQMDLLVGVPGGNQVYFHHGLSKDVMKVVAQRGVCVVQGHYHTEFKIGYLGNPNHLLWGLQVGCSIDGDSLAFAYDRTNLGRPIIGHGIILEGLPKLLPMVLGRDGRWNQTVP